jgi:hypothetical protein
MLPGSCTLILVPWTFLDIHQRYFLTYLNGGRDIAVVVLWGYLNQ